MAGFSDILDDLLDVAKAVAPLIPGGGSAIAAGEALIKIIDRVSGDTPSRPLEQVRDELAGKLADMNDHADSTIAKLRGED